MRIKSVSTADVDRDGHVDRVVVRLSGKVRGRRQTKGSFPFAVKGYRVVRMDRPRGRKVTLRVRERSECDVGARPVVRYTGRGRGALRDARKRKLRRHRVDPMRRNRSAPRMSCAITRDEDSDGRIDAVVVTFSRDVRNRSQSTGNFPFNVEGYRIASVGRARGRFVRIALRERSAPDTGAAPAISYRKPRRKADRRYAVTARVAKRRGRRRKKVEAFTGNFKATRDGAPPRLVAARTLDANANGALDGVVAELSEPVKPGGAGAFGVAGAQVTGVAGAGERELAVAIAEGGLDTGARPALSYTGAGKPVRDAAGNEAVPAGAVPADAAPPVLLAAVTADAGGVAGRLDAVSLFFSEPVAKPHQAGGPHPFAVSGYPVAAAGAATGSRVDLQLAEGPAPDTGARPAASYSPGAGGAPVLDAAGNEAVARSVVTADGVQPRLLSATTIDADADGQLDGLRLDWSEPISHAAGGGSPFTVLGFTVLGAGAASGSSLTLALAEPGVPNTGARPGVSYLPGVSGAEVGDLAGNPAGASSVLAAADGAPPAMLSAATADTDSNMRIDRIDTTWSEPLSHAGDASAPFPLGASGGYALAGVGPAAGTSLAVDLVEAADPDTGSAPTLTYTRGTGVAVKDMNGLEAGSKPYSGLTRDAVAPALVAAETKDATANGKLDRIDLHYSEEVTGSTATAPFAVVGRTVQSISYATDRVRVGIAEAGSSDTADTPAVTYVPGDVADIPEGDGDTAEPAPAIVAQTPLDRAEPILVQAVTGDDDADGTIDRVTATFSEGVTSEADTTSPFALSIANRTVTQVQAASGSAVTAAVAEASTPDGGYKPNVTVNSLSSSAPERIRDAAGNQAKALTFGGAQDGVRPVMTAAQMGESDAGACGKAPPVNGKADCVLTTWSEQVSYVGDSDGSYPLSIDSGYSIPASGISASSSSTALTIPLQEKASPDRDKAANVSYDGASGAPGPPVADAANNAGLMRTVEAARACNDTINEDNDARASDNPQLSPLNPSPQRKCAFDDDWFRVTSSSSGELKAVVRPASGLATDVTLVDSLGIVAATATEGDVTPGTNDAGQADYLHPGSGGAMDPVTGLAPNTTYWLRVTAPDLHEGNYCVAVSVTAEDPVCGPNVGDLIVTEAGLDSDRFVEVKNVSENPVDFTLVPIQLTRDGVTCSVSPPPGESPTIQAGQYATITAGGAGGTFACSEVANLSGTGNLLHIASGSTIDLVDLRGVLTPAVAAGRSLSVKPAAENATDNDDVQRNWCRTWDADSKGGAGDGCARYRINEVLFNPAPGGPGGADGHAFVEIAGNLPAKTGSELLAGWIVRGVNGETRAGSDDFVLPAGASPRENGTYVVADGLASNPGVTNVSAYDIVWNDLNLADPAWPDLASSPDAGPRGLQLLKPGTPQAPPCNATLFADAFGWSTTGEPFQATDSLRQCKMVEGQEYVVPTQGRSAARENLSGPGDTSYATGNDTDDNRADFYEHCPPSPGELNVRVAC